MQQLVQVPRKFWPVLILLFTLFLALGAAGWKRTLEEATGHAGIGKVLENVAEMVTGNDVIVVDHKYDENWMLVLGKWGIKAVLAIALLRSVLVLFRSQIRLWRFRKVRGHQVFVGLGGQNADLGLREAQRGATVAVLAEDEHHPRRGELEEAGALVIPGMPTDPQALRNAGVERAARVVVAAAAGDDEGIASAEVVAAMPGTGKNPLGDREILVCLDCRHTRDLLNRRWKLINGAEPGSTTKIVSFESAALRQMVTGMARDLAVVSDATHRPPCILVVANGDFTREFLHAAISFVQISGDLLPEYWVAVDNPEEELDFARLHPAADLVARVNFFVAHEAVVPVSPALAGKAFDLAIVKQTGESRTLHLAARLLDSPLFATTRAEAIVTEPIKTRLAEDGRLRVSSLFELGLNSPEFGDFTLEEKARANHEAYLAGLPPADRAKGGEWRDLPENFKESNRRAVLHREIKREIWERTPEAERASMLEHLAICEHQRWMGEKAMDGWRHGDLPEQDRKRRLHPSLIPWANLSESEKNKDRVQVRKALGLVD